MSAKGSRKHRTSSSRATGQGVSSSRRPERGTGLDPVSEVAAREWTKETVKIRGIVLSRMNVALITEIDGGVALVAHHESTSRRAGA